MHKLTPNEKSEAEWGCAEEPPYAPVHGWAVPPPKLDGPLRKVAEREADDPEGNLTIGRCAEEALLRREAAQAKPSARAKRSGRKEPRGENASANAAFRAGSTVGAVVPTFLNSTQYCTAKRFADKCCTAMTAHRMPLRHSGDVCDKF
jgi:hypothetical protein